MKITKEFIENRGFVRSWDGFGWAKYRKNGFELVEIPLSKGGIVIGFEYQVCGQVKYKYPITEFELKMLYEILTNDEL